MPTPVIHVWRPSIARRVFVDGFVPVPRGAIPATPGPLVWPAKDPADILDYELDISAALGGEADSISTVDVATWPNDLACTSTSADGNLVILWLSGGTAGIDYTVSVTVGTAAGRTIARAIQLPVQALAAIAPIATSLTTAAGTAITDQSGNPILVGS